VFRGRSVPKALLALKVLRVFKEPLGPKVLLGHREQWVTRALMVTSVAPRSIIHLIQLLPTQILV
jgi:hypothetical protein